MILKLILKNYIPLLSSGITHLEMTFPKDINLLISTNGAGKSSILREMSPLPPDNAMYKADGLKYVELLHNQKVYKLSSTPGKGNGHSFKVDGVEQNDGGTLTVQKGLVLDHFNLDLNLHKVLSGIKVPDLLSNMSPLRRKDVFMRLYPNNTDYALKMFNKFKDERNSLKGAIKNQISRYTEEKKKLETLNSMSVDELESQIKYIEDELKHALLLRGQLEGIKADPRWSAQYNEFSLLVDRLTLSVGNMPEYTHEELCRQAERTETLLDFNRKNAAKYTTIINELTKNLSGLNLDEQDPVKFKAQLEIIQEELVRTDKVLTQRLTILKDYPVFNDHELHEELVLLTENFIPYLQRITLVSGDEMSSGVYKKLLADAEALSNSIRLHKQEIQQWSHQLKHMQAADVLECPDCKHTFKQGITPQDIQKVEEALTNGRNRVTREEQQLVDLQRKLDNDAEWYHSMNQLLVFIRENQHVRILPTLLKEYQLGKNSSDSLINALRMHTERVKLVKRRSALIEEESVLQGRIRILENNNMSQALAHIKWAEAQLAESNHGIQLQIRKLANINKQLDALRRHDTDLETLGYLQTNLYQGWIDEAKVDLRNSVDGIISTLGPRKDRYLTDIIRSRSLSSVVASIEEDLHRLKRRQLIVETFMDGLCPNKGLIGKLMGDFIHAVCGNMNAIIHEVWNERLLVKPCTKENGDLTYKFPVINGIDSENSDIVDCSGGESEIIDFAFRLVMIMYHGGTYPLIMDEVGVYFDEINRGRFFTFIRNLMLTGDYSRLFMISHYVSQYGIFKDANIIAIKREGLTIDGVVNEYTDITYA